jgi:K+-sensing histidine kinase KdpD/ActR/RegA family two-component response regulator
MTEGPVDAPRPRSLTAGYAVALIASMIAGVVQYFLQPILGERFLLAAFPAAVVIAAWFGGYGAGLLATLTGSLTAVYFFLRPAQAVQIDDPANAASLLLFILVGLLISLAVRHLRQEMRVERDARTETERQLRRTASLQQITATLSRATTPAEVTRTCLPELLHAVDATAGAVLLIADDGSECELAHAIGYADRPVEPGHKFTVTAASPLADAIRRRELVAATLAVEAAPASGEQRPWVREGDVVVPLIAAGRVIGAVIVNILPPRLVDSEESQFLLKAGRHTAQALDRARLYETAERARTEAEGLRVRADTELRERQKAQEALRLSEAKYRSLAVRTSRLYALSAGLSEAVRPEAVASAIVHLGKVVVGASAGSVVLLVESGTQFQTLYGDEHSSTRADAARAVPLDEGLAATAAVKTGRPIFVGSFAEWQEKYPQSASIAADGGYASAAVLPLLSEGSVLGVLSFYFTAPVNCDEEYTALLVSVAQHCAQALDRARLYETADRARSEAEAANRSKDDFLSTISHELRTPLNAMLGWAAMLRSGAVDAGRIQRAVDAIFNSATRQGRLIEDLLDVSRIVAGRASFEVQDVDLGENIRGAVEAMMPQAAAKRVDIRFETTPGVRVFADPRRLEQVFLNLLSNAVKFTPAGGRIAVDVAVSGQSVDVRVTDTGAGIAPAFLPHVFDRFRQADSATTRSAGGLGLGLFIARQLVEAQGGAIRVESEGTGCGATLTVTLPTASGAPAVHHIAAAAATMDLLEPMPVLDGVRVLLVDDEPDAREVMAAALESCGATVTSTSSALEAFETLARTEIDLLLSDIAMPGEDGCELIRRIRSLPSPRLASLPAAAVTAYARDDERGRALAAGFQMHLTKPIHPVALARAVATLAFGAPSAASR